MKPLKRKDIGKKVSEELNISSEDIDDIILTYYKYVGELVSSLEYERIYITNVCNLIFKPKPGTSRLAKDIALLRAMNAKADSEKVLQARSFYQNRIGKLQTLLDKSNSIKEQKQQTKQQRNEYNTNMES